jgi:hypothetical protein
MSKSEQSVTSATVVTGRLHPTRQRHTKKFANEPPVAPELVHRPARVAIMLALAHKIQQAIDRGVVRDRAEVARRLGMSRARITQLIDLTLLAPDIQERILFAEVVDGLEPMSERHLREEGSHRRSVSTSRTPTSSPASP